MSSPPAWAVAPSSGQQQQPQQQQQQQPPPPLMGTSMQQQQQPNHYPQQTYNQRPSGGGGMMDPPSSMMGHHSNNHNHTAQPPPSYTTAPPPTPSSRPTLASIPAKPSHVNHRASTTSSFLNPPPRGAGITTSTPDEELEDGRVRNAEAVTKIRDAWIYTQISARAAEFTQHKNVSEMFALDVMEDLFVQLK